MNWRDVPWFNILFVVVALYAMNQFSLNQNADKINDLHVAAALDAKEKENIEALYTASVTAQQQLEVDKVELLELRAQDLEQIESHAQRIAELEEETAGGRLTVRRIDTRAAILDAFKKTFPDLSTGADFGIVKIYDEVEGLNQDYLSLPVMYSQTFIIEHNELVNARAEIQERKDIEALYGNAIDLSNKVIDKDKEIAGLKDKNTIVYKEGYEAGYARTVELRDDLESCYKEPRFKMPGVGTLALCAAGVGGGIYLGTQF